MISDIQMPDDINPEPSGWTLPDLCGLDPYDLQYLEAMLSVLPVTALTKRVRAQIRMIRDHGVGDGVGVYMGEGGLTSTIIHNCARYCYVTNASIGAEYTTDYNRTILDLIGGIKDGDINVIELYDQNGTCNRPGAPWEITYKVGTETYRVTSRRALDERLDGYADDHDPEMGSILEHIDRRVVMTIVPDREIGDGPSKVYTMDMLSGEVVMTRYNKLSEVIDLMMHQTVLKVIHAPQ